MVCGIISGLAFASTSLASDWERLAWLAGAGFIQLRLLANLLDGMVAIESGRASPVGELYNEVPDRVSDTAILVGVGFASGGTPSLGLIAACAALFTAYVRAMGKAAGAPHEFCGPMAKQQRMALLTIAALYCASVPKSWQPSWGASSEYGFMAAVLLIISVGSLLTAIRRLLRIANNLRESQLNGGEQ